MPDNTNTVAAESFAFWSPLVRLPVHAFAWLAMQDGETSFRIHAVGDHGEAYGDFQDHTARVEEILKGTGIDVRTASNLDQLRGAYWECTKGWYKKVWPELIATETLEAAVRVLVRDFEQSSQQERDVTRRLAMAQKWQGVFGAT